jgi:transposase
VGQNKFDFSIPSCYFEGMDSTTAERIKITLPLLNERQARLYLAGEAKGIGYGGVTQVSEVSGVSRNTISRGLIEINAPGYEPRSDMRIRRPGAGRKPIEEKIPELDIKIGELIEPYTSGSPENGLTWTSKSTRNLSDELLNSFNINISYKKVGRSLKKLGYTLQSNRKNLALKPSHPDRDEQFRYINKLYSLFSSNNQPVISIDAKKKELIGNFKNNGIEYYKKGFPLEVLDHDFMIKELGKATPFGVYDIFANHGFVNVGISNDTAEFAVQSIQRWWKTVGIKRYPKATNLYITCDSGGSNGYKVRLCKREIEKLANNIGLEITISHFPLGTSKWNKIEHMLFSFISKNWRGKPLTSLAVIVNLIAGTKTKNGLKVDCYKDTNQYPKGIEISDKEFKKILYFKHIFHGEWNYTFCKKNLFLSSLISSYIDK